ncbi:MAG: hypothetical protein AAFS10_13355 [Myxococcota bacterium]
MSENDMLEEEAKANDLEPQTAPEADEQAPPAPPDPQTDDVALPAPDPSPRAQERLVVEGRVERKPLPRLLKIVFGVTGISLIIYLVDVVLRLVLGLRRSGRLLIDGDALTMEEETRFVGREIRAARERFSRPDVLSVRLEQRYPYLLTLVGLLCLGVGVIAGIFLLLDGFQGEFTPWIISGVGLLMAGVLLDLVFTTLAASLPGQAALIIHLPGKRALRLVGCEANKAEDVVRWLDRTR